MADLDHKPEAVVKPPPKPEHTNSGEGASHGDTWSRLSGDLHAFGKQWSKLETRALEAGASLAVDAAVLYVKAFPPEAKHQLYRTADGTDSIRAKDVVQGGINDCFFTASLAAVADTAPNIIKNSIKSNADGSYTVTFPGAKDSPVQTPALTDYELKNYAKESPDGVWPAVMEKAFGIYLQDHPDEKDKILGRANKGVWQSMSNWVDNHVLDAFNSHPQELADTGDSTAVLKLLTGYQPGGLSLKEAHSVEGAKSLLAGAFKQTERVPTVAAIDEGNKTTQELGLHSKHAYTVLNYANGIVTLRDPNAVAAPNEQGKTMPSKDGVFDMKVEDFARAYDEVYTGRLTPLFGGSALIFKGFTKNLKDQK